MGQFWTKIRSGEKTMTCRTKAYGVAGDMLETPIGAIELISVTRVPLGTVATRHWKEEGLTEPREFVEIWKELHPGGYDPKQLVYLHQFKYIGE